MFFIGVDKQTTDLGKGLCYFLGKAQTHHGPRDVELDELGGSPA